MSASWSQPIDAEACSYFQLCRTAGRAAGGLVLLPVPPRRRSVRAVAPGAAAARGGAARPASAGARLGPGAGRLAAAWQRGAAAPRLVIIRLSFRCYETYKLGLTL